MKIVLWIINIIWISAALVLFADLVAGKDVDGNSYAIVLAGIQIWLNYRHLKLLDK